MNAKVALRILGITFSQVQAGAYALILSEQTGKRRIPIIIGTPEAQSIAIFLENLKPPRPLTHDLFRMLTEALQVQLLEMDIYQYKEGVFYSELVYRSGEKTIRLDARTSDAIAIAIRAKAPIYIDKVIMDEASVVMDDDDLWDESSSADAPAEKPAYENMNLEELQEHLNEAVSGENYEQASYLHELMEKLRKTH
ncbi:MAG: bifunctional nuclease family protein [Dysgonamonadaceae bacterium]|jgi:bifunctional DNase/RNase|nr:bifunctional nuclease family protein [Dysgonamonadaceae bacterium]